MCVQMCSCNPQALRSDLLDSDPKGKKDQEDWVGSVCGGGRSGSRVCVVVPTRQNNEGRYSEVCEHSLLRELNT